MEKVRKKRYKLKWKNFTTLLFTTVCLITLIISTINIIRWKIDSNKTSEIITSLNDPTEIEDTKDTEIIKQEEEIPKSNPYWDYIKMKMIDVNFNELKAKNNETVGWIQLNGTNINYPIVQTSDNKFYLTHSFDKSYNSAGWVFMDYRNNSDVMDRNTILYAHSRYDKTMFGSLKNILTSTWINNSNNYVIKLSSEFENTLWQIFSIYHIPTTTDYLKINFYSEDEFTEFANSLISRSNYNFNTTVNKEDKILTLSTCYNNDTERIVLHAKLIKRTAKNNE